MKSFCYNISLDCKTYNEVTVSNCDGYVVEANLASETAYFLIVLDKFRNLYYSEIVTDFDGSFTIDPNDFPDKLFNVYGGMYEVYISTNSSGTDKVEMTINSTAYDALLATYTVCCDGSIAVDCDNDFDFAEPCNTQYIAFL